MKIFIDQIFTKDQFDENVINALGKSEAYRRKDQSNL